MKTFLLSALSLLISVSAFAEIPEIRAKEVTCQELKDAVLNYGQVTVVTKSFLVRKRLTVSQEIECGAGLLKTQAVFKTSDVSACAAGVYCADNSTVIIVVDHQPRHERYRWRHRPTHPAPDHHPRGPRYNPRPDRPHERGPRYNPRPDHDRPSHDRPSHDRPSHDRPSHDRPSHDRPSHDRPSHDRPSHDRPSHDRPSHDRPSHDRPSHDRPSHDRPSHDRPSRGGGCHGRHCSL